MLEAAVSSAICHAHVVQTYDYQVVDRYQSATVLRTEANRVCPHCPTHAHMPASRLQLAECMRDWIFRPSASPQLATSLVLGWLVEYRDVTKSALHMLETRIIMEFCDS